MLAVYQRVVRLAGSARAAQASGSDAEKQSLPIG
jgi:hypothetical protein